MSIMSFFHFLSSFFFFANFNGIPLNDCTILFEIFDKIHISVRQFLLWLAQLKHISLLREIIIRARDIRGARGSSERMMKMLYVESGRMHRYTRSIAIVDLCVWICVYTSNSHIILAKNLTIHVTCVWSIKFHRDKSMKLKLTHLVANNIASLYLV